jgi:hypothetical protein
MKSKTAVLGSAIMLAIVLVWALAFPLSRQMPDSVFAEPFGSVYNGLNVLFTALAFGGVVITLLFQAEQSRNARREEIERSIFELFQTFTSLEFQKVKDGAFRALLAAVKDSDYAHYLATRLFVVDQAAFPVKVIPILRQLDEAKKELTDGQIEHADRADRLMLDNMLNFFALLAQRESSAMVIKHCDFAYDWWRPTLWMIGQLQEEHYARSPLVQQYCKTQLITGTLKALDKVYGHSPLSGRAPVWEYITHHPKMLAFGMDPAFAKEP